MPSLAEWEMELANNERISRFCDFKPFTARQRRLVWKKKPTADVKVGDIMRATDSGNALLVRKVDDRGVIVKRVGFWPAKDDRKGECHIISHAYEEG